MGNFGGYPCWISGVGVRNFPGKARNWTCFFVKKLFPVFRSQVEAPVEMSSFSVVLPCAFEGEFAEKTVWAVWENTAPWFWKWKPKNILGRGILDRKMNLERRKASFYWKGTFQKIP